MYIYSVICESKDEVYLEVERMSSTLVIYALCAKDARCITYFLVKRLGDMYLALDEDERIYTPRTLAEISLCSRHHSTIKECKSVYLHSL